MANSTKDVFSVQLASNSGVRMATAGVLEYPVCWLIRPNWTTPSVVDRIRRGLFSSKRWRNALAIPRPHETVSR